MPSKKENRHRMFSLKRQISGIFAFLIFVFIMLLTILLTIMVNRYQNELDERRMNHLETYAETLNTSILQMNDVTGEIYMSNMAFDGLNVFKSEAKKYDYIYDLFNLIRIQVKSNQNLDGLFVFYDNARKALYYLQEDISFEDKEALKNQGRFLTESITGSYRGAVIQGEEDVYYNVIMKKSLAAAMGNVKLSRGLPEQEENGAIYGVLYEGLFYQTGGQGTYKKIESFGTLNPGRNRIGDQLVYCHKLNSTDMTVVEIVPRDMWQYVSPVHILLFILSSVLIGLLFRLYYFIYMQISVPLEDMTRALQQIQIGVWEAEFHADNRITEIENVRQTVNMMLKEIEQYKITNYENRIARQKTELQYYRLQLAPHFYTNCLKNAYYMMMLKEYDNVEQFLLCLSTHLRYLLQKNISLVSLRTEKEFVQNYINLQNLMDAGKILYEIDVPDELLDHEIPILTLQTFVENSVKYGRTEQNGSLHIRMQIRMRNTEEGDYLDFMIRDGGAGYPESVLEILNQENPSEKQGLGVGIINLLNRARLVYGERVQCYFRNEEGAFSELLLPVGGKTEDEDFTGR